MKASFIKIIGFTIVGGILFWFVYDAYTGYQVRESPLEQLILSDKDDVYDTMRRIEKELSKAEFNAFINSVFDDNNMDMQAIAIVSEYCIAKEVVVEKSLVSRKHKEVTNRLGTPWETTVDGEPVRTNSGRVNSMGYLRLGQYNEWLTSQN